MIKVSKRDTCNRYYLLQLFGFAIFLHHIHHNEDEGIYHNHPWTGISFIFGRYFEQRYGENPKVRWGFHLLPAKIHHRITLPWGPVWTLFFHFRRSNQWTVIDSKGKVLATEPWRAIGGPTSYSPNK